MAPRIDRSRGESGRDPAPGEPAAPSRASIDFRRLYVLVCVAAVLWMAGLFWLTRTFHVPGGAP